jgi:hypothetical protein
MTRRNLQIKCALCEKKVSSKEQSKAIVEIIEGINYNFDNPDCLLMFKKFRAVHGNHMFSQPYLYYHEPSYIADPSSFDNLTLNDDKLEKFFESTLKIAGCMPGSLN